MADGRALLSSDECIDSGLGKLNLQSIRLEDVIPNLVYDQTRLKWLGDFESLKKFVKDCVGVLGKWSAPGGGSKQFRSENGEFVLTWYCKKQKTLVFQGGDGNAFKEKLIQHCVSTTHLPDMQSRALSSQIDLLSSSPESKLEDEPTSQPVIVGMEELKRVVKTMDKGTSTSIDDCFELINSSSHGCCDSCPCRTLTTDIEGIKLDIVILQKQMEYKSNKATTHNKDETLKCELLVEKEKNRQLENDISLLVKGRNEEVDDLNKTIHSLEDRVIKAEEERDSLRLAISLIMQDKVTNACVNGTKEDEWRFGGKAKSKTQNKTQQSSTNHQAKQVKEMSTDYRSAYVNGDNSNRNRFAVLRDHNHGSTINDNHFDEGDSPRVNDVHRNNRHSKNKSRKCQGKKIPTMEGKEHDKSHGQANSTKKDIYIVGDSILKDLQGRRLSSKNRVKVSSFPGCNTLDMRDHAKPIMRRNPDEVIIHVGTNSLSQSNSARYCAEEIVDLAMMIDNECSASVAVSSLVNRSDDESLIEKINDVNKIVKHFCNQNNWGYIDHSNILVEQHLNRSGLHLNKQGTTELACNFIKYLRND